MPKINVKYEAVRYLSALALYENCNVSRDILNIVSYNKRSVTFSNIISEPYNRSRDTNRALKVISNILDKSLNDWYFLVQTDDGRREILKSLHGVSSDVDLDLTRRSLVIKSESELLDFLKCREARFANFQI